MYKYNWRRNQTPLAVMRLKGRLPQKLQTKSTFSCETVQIHSLFRRGVINKPNNNNKKKKTEIENRCIL